MFISFFILFVLAFDIGSYFLVEYSYQYNLEREVNSAMHQHSIISLSIERTIYSISDYFAEETKEKQCLETANKLITYNYDQKQEVDLSLYNNRIRVNPSSQQIDTELLTFKNKDTLNLQNKVIDNKRYIFVAAPILSTTFKDLTLVLSQDITSLDDYRETLINLLIVISTSVSLALAVATYFLLKKLTRPIKELNETSKEIAAGAYDKRINIKSNDELGELADTFNIMVDSIKDKIAQLTQSAKEKQDFIDNLAHEMKTPLTAIIGHSQFMQNAMSNEEERAKAAFYITEAANRLKMLESKLLDLMYLRSTDIEKKAVDVTAVVALLKDLTAISLKERKLSLITIIEIDVIKGDETLLLSLLTNLVENAARASKENDIITIKAYFTEFPIIEVIDNGCGMDKNEIKKIMQPFYRIDKSRSRQYGGVGLGLSICSRIVELHGAEFEIYSEINKGTIIKISFLQDDNN